MVTFGSVFSQAQMRLPHWLWNPNYIAPPPAVIIGIPVTINTWTNQKPITPNIQTRGAKVARIIILRLNIAQKPHIVWSLSPKAINYESLEPSG